MQTIAMLQWNPEPFKSASIEDDSTTSNPRTQGSRSIQGFQKADALTLGFVMGVAVATFSLVWLGDNELAQNPGPSAEKPESDSGHLESALVGETALRSRESSNAARSGDRTPGSAEGAQEIRLLAPPRKNARGVR
jgi:hypothetical protein